MSGDELRAAARAALAVLDLIAQGQAFTEWQRGVNGERAEVKARRASAQTAADRLRTALDKDGTP